MKMFRLMKSQSGRRWIPNMMIGLQLAFGLLCPRAFGGGIVVDHTCTDLTKIPAQWITTARDRGWKMYYMYRSHGSQVTDGLQTIRTNNTNCAFAIAERTLPSAPRSINMFGWYGIDGSGLPQYFWLGTSGRAQTRQVLTNNPTINLASWASSGEGRDWSPLDITNYLNSMSLLEAEFPNVKFIYTTFNTQAWDDGTNKNHTFNNSYLGNANLCGSRTHTNNQIIRQWCQAYNKILFDFGDIDSWYQGQQLSSSYQGRPFPREHDHYNIDQVGHSSYENAVNKGAAMWWLLARLSGWTPGAVELGIRTADRGTVQIEFTAASNTVYAVQACTNLQNNSWHPVANISAKPYERAIVLVDFSVLSVKSQYYRVQTLP